MSDTACSGCAVVPRMHALLLLLAATCYMALPANWNMNATHILSGNKVNNMKDMCDLTGCAVAAHTSCAHFVFMQQLTKAYQCTLSLRSCSSCISSRLNAPVIPKNLQHTKHKGRIPCCVVSIQFCDVCSLPVLLPAHDAKESRQEDSHSSNGFNCCFLGIDIPLMH